MFFQAAGADITTINSALAELAQNWTSPAGQAIQPIALALIPE